MSEPIPERSMVNESEDPSLEWFTAVGTVVAPLFAGFSFTTVVVVSDNAVNFRWPGLTMLVLTIAVLVLISTVQCAYRTRVWYAQAKRHSDLKLILWKYRDPWKMGDFYREWTRRAYNWGLIFLLGGLALTLPPKDGSNIQADFRWSAFGLALLVCSWQLERVVKQWILWLLRAPKRLQRPGWFWPPADKWPSSPVRR
jgi:hypothetical protein